MKNVCFIWALIMVWALTGTLTAEGAPVATGTTPPSVQAGHDHAGMDQILSWTGSPLLKIRKNAARGGGQNSMSTVVIPENITPDAIRAYSNSVKDKDGQRILPIETGGALLDKPASGGLHMLTAREERADRVLVASMVYYFGRKTSKNPTTMFMQQKNELEIIPQPYPGEHGRYRANEKWKFLVRFNSRPLAGQRVVFESQNGTRKEFVSDRKGVVSVLIPNDFKPEEEKQQKKPVAGDHGMQRGSDLVLFTEYADGGKVYLTSFNSAYRPDAFEKRSLSMGLGFTFLGMIVAVPLLRQRRPVAGGNSITKAPVTDECGGRGALT
ncbi:MAG: hypothetical protein ACOYL3_14760 [Desulfuromonadaceae bacterium]